MADYIDKQAAIDAIHEVMYSFFCGAEDNDVISDTEKLMLTINKVICGKKIKALPSADVQPVRHGKWVKKWHTGFHKELPCCSVCGHCAAFWWDYCPSCGARMDGE